MPLKIAPMAGPHDRAVLIEGALATGASANIMPKSSAQKRSQRSSRAPTRLDAVDEHLHFREDIEQV